MPRFSDLELLDAGFSAGAIFFAKNPTGVDFARNSPGVSVQARARTRWIAVKLSNPPPRAGLLETALSEAQIALDLLGRHQAFVELNTPMLDHLLWHSSPDGVHLRVASMTLFDAPRMHFTATVTRADGTVKPNPPPPPWHPLLRFYRLAHLTEDPIERFRYLYLAIENAVSGISPKLSSESESAWLRRVLVAEAVDCAAALAGPVPSSSVSPVDAIVDLVYRQARTSAFHAKQGRGTFLPADPDALRTASGACDVALRLVRQLGDRAGQPLIQSGLFQGGFEILTANLHKMVRICFSADARAHDPTETAFSDPAHTTVELAPTASTHLFTHIFRATVSEPTAIIARAGLAAGGEPIAALCLESPLDPTGFNSMEFVLGIHMRQAGGPWPALPDL